MADERCILLEVTDEGKRGDDGTPQRWADGAYNADDKDRIKLLFRVSRVLSTCKRSIHRLGPLRNLKAYRYILSLPFSFSILWIQFQNVSFCL